MVSRLRRRLFFRQRTYPGKVEGKALLKGDLVFHKGKHRFVAENLHDATIKCEDGTSFRVSEIDIDEFRHFVPDPTKIATANLYISFAAIVIAFGSLVVAVVALVRS